MHLHISRIISSNPKNTIINTSKLLKRLISVFNHDQLLLVGDTCHNTKLISKLVSLPYIYIGWSVDFVIAALLLSHISSYIIYLFSTLSLSFFNFFFSLLIYHLTITLPLIFFPHLYLFISPLLYTFFFFMWTLSSHLYTICNKAYPISSYRSTTYDLSFVLNYLCINLNQCICV